MSVSATASVRVFALTLCVLMAGCMMPPVSRSMVANPYPLRVVGPHHPLLPPPAVPKKRKRWTMPERMKTGCYHGFAYPDVSVRRRRLAHEYSMALSRETNAHADCDRLQRETALYAERLVRALNREQ